MYWYVPENHFSRFARTVHDLALEFVALCDSKLPHRPNRGRIHIYAVSLVKQHIFQAHRHTQPRLVLARMVCRPEARHEV
jgi:phytoene/squalene synthetase